MSVVAPEHCFLGSDQTSRRPHFTTGNTATAFIDGRDYMADLGVVLNAASGEVLIAGWRVSGEQILVGGVPGRGVGGGAAALRGGRP
jgi:hypothetical protein